MVKAFQSESDYKLFRAEKFGFLPIRGKSSDLPKTEQAVFSREKITCIFSISEGCKGLKRIPKTPHLENFPSRKHTNFQTEVRQNNETPWDRRLIVPLKRKSFPEEIWKKPMPEMVSEPIKGSYLLIIQAITRNWYPTRKQRINFVYQSRSTNLKIRKDNERYQR